MQKRIGILGTFLLFFSAELSWGGILPIPPELCQEAWSDKAPEDYLYNFSQDPKLTTNSIASKTTDGYRTYIDRMKQKGIDRLECHKTWTVLIYMAASEDLLPYAYADLNEMEATLTQSSFSSSSSVRTDVLVQFDTGTSPQTRRLHMFQNKDEKFEPLSKEKLNQLTENRIHSPIVSIVDRKFPESEKERLKSFLKWGIEEYPSEHYLVLLWGHGQGWTAVEGPPTAGPSSTPPSASAPKTFGGLALGTSTGYLDIPALRSVFRDLTEWTGAPIDVFASDACLMQSVEDVTELADQTHFVCGSEDIESYAGLPYGALLSQLNSGKFDGAMERSSHEDITEGEPRWVAWMIPQLYKEAFDTSGSQRALDPKACDEITGCSVSTKHLQTSLIPRLNLLGTALLKFIEETPIRWMDLKSLIAQGPTFLGGTQDLGAFLKGLSELISKDTATNGILDSTNVRQPTPATAQVLRILRKIRIDLNYTVVNVVLGTKYPPFDSKKEFGPRGLSIWLPQTDSEYRSRIQDFSKSIFYGSDTTVDIPGWRAWMAKMYPPEDSPEVYED